MSIIKSYTPKLKKSSFSLFVIIFVFWIVIFKCNSWFQTIHLLVLFALFIKTLLCYGICNDCINQTYCSKLSLWFRLLLENPKILTIDYFDMIFLRILMIILLTVVPKSNVPIQNLSPFETHLSNLYLKLCGLATWESANIFVPKTWKDNALFRDLFDFFGTDGCCWL